MIVIGDRWSPIGDWWSGRSIWWTNHQSQITTKYYQSPPSTKSVRLSQYFSTCKYLEYNALKTKRFLVQPLSSIRRNTFLSKSCASVPHVVVHSEGDQLRIYNLQYKHMTLTNIRTFVILWQVCLKAFQPWSKILRLKAFKPWSKILRLKKKSERKKNLIVGQKFAANTY